MSVCLLLSLCLSVSLSYFFPIRLSVVMFMNSFAYDYLVYCIHYQNIAVRCTKTGIKHGERQIIPFATQDSVIFYYSHRVSHAHLGLPYGLFGGGVYGKCAGLRRLKHTAPGGERHTSCFSFLLHIRCVLLACVALSFCCLIASLAQRVFRGSWLMPLNEALIVNRVGDITARRYFFLPRFV